MIDKIIANVFETHDYDKFKLVKGNRIIKRRKVDVLKKTMSKQLLICPIIVNSNFEIIDGQHRFTAVKELRLPVYYIIKDGYDLPEVIVMNTHATNWNVNDFAEAYSKKGNENYTNYCFFKEMYPSISDQVIRHLLQGSAAEAHHQGGDYFKQGNFKVKDINEASKFAEIILSYNVCGEIFKNNRFQLSVSRIIRHPNYNHQRMMAKIKYQAEKLKICSNQSGFYEIWTAIYNYKRGPTEEFLDFKTDLINKWKSGTF